MLQEIPCAVWYLPDTELFCYRTRMFITVITKARHQTSPQALEHNSYIQNLLF